MNRHGLYRDLDSEDLVTFKVTDSDAHYIMAVLLDYDGDDIPVDDIYNELHRQWLQ